MAKQRKLTVASSEVPSDQTDYAAYADISGLGITYGEVRVYKSDGTTEVAREVNDAGELHWLCDGVLSSSTDTEYWMHYDNGLSDYAEDATYGREAVWSNAGSGSGYVLVAHLHEDPSGSAPQMLDSTSNDSDGTSAGSMTAGDSVSGKLAGNALDFDGTSDYIAFANESLYDFGTAEFTLSLWFKHSATGRMNMAGKTATSEFQYAIEQESSGKLLSHIDKADGNSVVGGQSAGTGWNNSAWHHVATVWDTTDPETGQQYLDGSLNGDSNYGSPGTYDYNTDGPGKLSIGYRERTPALYYTGQLDEVRAYSGSLSADWIATEHSNQDDVGTFITVGAEEEVSSGGASAYYYKNLLSG